MDNQLTAVNRNGALTVAGLTTPKATNVTVNTDPATLYADKTFAREISSLNDGTNTFTAIAEDAAGRKDTNSITVNLPESVAFTYDDNGNLTSDSNRTFQYDDENQLTNVFVSGSWKSEFVYDGFQRRRVRKEYAWQSSAWVLTNEVRYVYDGSLVIQERDGNNTPLVTYTRGTDLSGSLQGAGGIGGLLARTDHTTARTAFYHADGGNVTALVNSSELLVAKYLYDPFGFTLAKDGPLADANAFRFSSKEFHANSGLYYYGFRLYDPGLQRWINQDPIGELGGINLHMFVENTPVNAVDPFGLWSFYKWLYARDGNASDETYDEALDGAAEGLGCLSKCLKCVGGKALALGAGLGSTAGPGLGAIDGIMKSKLSKFIRTRGVAAGASGWSQTTSARGGVSTGLSKKFGTNNAISKGLRDWTNASKAGRNTSNLRRIGLGVRSVARLGAVGSLVGLDAALIYCAAKCADGEY